MNLQDLTPFLQLLSKNAKLTKRFLDIANVVSENSVNDITNLHIDRDCTNLYAQHTSWTLETISEPWEHCLKFSKNEKNIWELFPNNNWPKSFITVEKSQWLCQNKLWQFLGTFARWSGQWNWHYKSQQNLDDNYFQITKN